MPRNVRGGGRGGAQSPPSPSVAHSATLEKSEEGPPPPQTTRGADPKGKGLGGQPDAVDDGEGVLALLEVGAVAALLLGELLGNQIQQVVPDLEEPAGAKTSSKRADFCGPS